MAALAFGCTMTFARAFGSSFSGVLFAGTAAQMDLVGTVSTGARVVVLVALTAALFALTIVFPPAPRKRRQGGVRDAADQTAAVGEGR